MCLRGNVFLYQGEELGLPQAEVPFERLVDPEAITNWPETLGRDGARTPIPWTASAPHAGFSPVEPWLPVDPRHVPLAVDRQEADPDATLHVARRAVALRHRLAALRIGELAPVETAAPVVAFIRGDGDAAVLCAFNLSGEPADWSPPSGWRVEEAVNGGDLSGTLNAYAALVAVQA